MGGSKISLELRMLLLLLAVATAAATSLALPGCNSTCGGVSIPYPFGMGTNCSLQGFDITCDFTFNPPKPFISTGNIEIVNISLIQGEMRIKKFIAYNCFSQTDIAKDNSNASIDLTTKPAYRLSGTRNKFTAIGCYTAAYIIGRSSEDFATGCMAFCSRPEDATDGSCTGTGCCQTSIPEDLDYYEVQWGFKNNTMWKTMPCTYAMLVDEKWYNFRISDLLGYKAFYKKNNGRVQLVLDWAVRNLTCPEAKASTDYACRSNSSECYNSRNGLGYICNCSQGYEGNPYLDKGCTDIDECAQPERYPCNGNCTNIPGGYNCTCPKGYEGNATMGSCKKPDKFPLVAKIVTGIIPVIVLLIKLAILIQKRKGENETSKNRKKNSDKLSEKMSSAEMDTVLRPFTEKELKKATSNFNDKRILGEGSRDKVYKGVLEKGQEVAIKKSKAVDQNKKAVDQNQKVVNNEIFILSKINHRSVVRLLGYCLEVPVPMLVYEFIPNGTLFDSLHDKNKSTISLLVRLDIAVDSADALAYVHSFPADPPIIHGAVKSSNILLGPNYKAKVSNLGTSSLLPLDDDQLVKLLKGTNGYLDPECISTRRLTDKSDVYSFGVVLLELITRKPAIYTDEASNETKSLASTFVSAMNQNKLHDILDDQIVDKGTIYLLEKVAQLSLRCVSVKREERPTMQEVKEELKILTNFENHPWGQMISGEAESLLDDHDISLSDIFSSTNITTVWE